MDDAHTPADAPKLRGLEFHRLLRLLLLFVGVVTITKAVVIFSSQSTYIPYFFFRQQDVYLAAIVIGGLLLVMRGGEAGLRPAVLARVKSTAATNWRFYLPILLFLACYAGHYLLLAGYDNTRDEQMASFDAQIFASGRLIAPIAPQWRLFADALNQTFILPIGHAEAWVSAYLPVNAAFRALFSWLGDASFTGPFFTALGAVALWNCAAKIWPDRRDIALLCLILYVTSGQILFTGMTSYAMNGHLALNLLWLNLFLLGRNRTDLAAIGIGFLATGLHQPLFHPMFVAPFLLLLCQQRAWRRLLIFVAAYAVIGAFWYGWPLWMSSFGVNPPPAGAIKLGYVDRLLEQLALIGPAALNLMLLNLLRLITWQHLLLVPLAIYGGVLACRQRNGLAVALALGIMLPIIVMAIILPYQGHGWGYRYLHGVLGNAILLAGFAWAGAGTVAGERNRLQRAMLMGTAITALLMLPLQGWFMHRFYSSYAEQSARITASAAQLAFVETTPLSIDLVVNTPDLSNRPVRLAASLINPADLPKLCSSGKTAIFVSRADLKPLLAFMGEPADSASLQFTQFRNAAIAAGCRPISLPASP